MHCSQLNDNWSSVGFLHESQLSEKVLAMNFLHHKPFWVRILLAFFLWVEVCVKKRTVVNFNNGLRNWYLIYGCGLTKPVKSSQITSFKLFRLNTDPTNTIVMNHSSVFQYEFSRKSETNVADFAKLTPLLLLRRHIKSQSKQTSFNTFKSHQLQDTRIWNYISPM